MSILGELGSSLTGYMPWQVDDFISGAGNLLEGGAAAAGSLSGIFTSSADRKAAQTPQFAYRPFEEGIADVDKMRAWLQSNTQPIVKPTRRLTTEEQSDSTFAPHAVSILQKIEDERNAASAAGQPQTIETQQQADGSYADAEMMMGMIEANRLANTDMGKMGWNKQTQRDMQFGNQAMGAGNFQSMLEPASQDYENPYGAGTFDRDAILRLLGKRTLAGDPTSTASSPHVQMTDEEMQARMAERNETDAGIESGMRPVTVRPQRMTLGSVFGGKILPAIGMAAFTGGVGMGGLPWQAADAVSSLENVTSGMNAVKRLKG
jgi:hypothetical protein